MTDFVRTGEGHGNALEAFRSLRCKPLNGAGSRRLAESNRCFLPETEEHVNAPLGEVAPDAGERFDPFCHTLDELGRALCFADIRGRSVHRRQLPTTSGAGHHPSCLSCGKVVCPTCLEIESRLFGAA